MDKVRSKSFKGLFIVIKKNIFILGTLLVLFLILGFKEQWINFLMPHKNTSPLIGGAFELFDENGKKVTDKDFRGQYMLVYFGYAFCPDICPTALENITMALEDLPESTRDQIVPIFITVDPQRDTLEFLKKYKTSYHPKFIMLRGNDEQTEVAQKAYRVHAQKVIPVPGQKEYLIDHSSIIYFMGKRGEFLAHFSHGTSPQDMIQKIIEVMR
jgi:protein SCO1/2